jgi:hypothetical protein
VTVADGLAVFIDQEPPPLREVEEPFAWLVKEVMMAVDYWHRRIDDRFGGGGHGVSLVSLMIVRYQIAGWFSDVSAKL